MATVVRADGIIISSATGRTAYAASSGASIVQPDVQSILVAPICPHSLSSRSIVVSADVVIKITLAEDSRDDSMISIDGRGRVPFVKGDVMTVATSPYPLASFSRCGSVCDWIRSLDRCLHWNYRKLKLP